MLCRGSQIKPFTLEIYSYKIDPAKSKGRKEDEADKKKAKEKMKTGKEGKKVHRKKKETRKEGWKKGVKRDWGGCTNERRVIRIVKGAKGE